MSTATTTKTCYDAGYANGWRDCLMGRPEMTHPLELSQLSYRLVDEIRTLMAHATAHDFNRYYTAYVDAYHSGYQACRRDESNQSLSREFTVELSVRVCVLASDMAEAEDTAKELLSSIPADLTAEVLTSQEGRTTWPYVHDNPDTTRKATQQ